MKRSLFVLGYLSDSDVEWLAAVAKVERYAVGEVLLRQGVQSRCLFFLIEGTAAVSVGGHRLTTASAGEMVGEISLFDSRPPSATLTAIEPIMALRIGFETLRPRLDADPEFASRLYYSLGALLAQRMRERSGSDLDDEDEMDPEVIERIGLAGRRMEALTERALASH